MTSTLSRRASKNGRAATREAAVSGTRPSPGPLRRRWGRIGVGVAAAVLGGWVFAALYLSAGDRAEVLVVAEDVARFEAIERSDLRVVRLSDDADVASISASRLDEFVGRTAGVDLVAGSLLAEAQLLPAGQVLLGEDEAVVGVLVGPGDGPSASLRRGDRVLVVVRPPAGGQGEPAEFEGWVFDASGEALNTRERPVEIALARADAALVSAAAADGRVTIVALAG